MNWNGSAAQHAATTDDGTYRITITAQRVEARFRRHGGRSRLLYATDYRPGHWHYAIEEARAACFADYYAAKVSA